MHLRLQGLNRFNALLTRSPSLRYALFCLVLACFGALVPLVYYRVILGATLSIEHIEVKGNTQIPSQEIVKSLEHLKGKPLYGVPLHEVVKALKQNARILDAHVRRIPPSTLEVNIEERKPQARLLLDKWYFVDQKGALYQTKESAAEQVPLLKLSSSLKSTAYIPLAGELIALLDYVGATNAENTGINTIVIDDVMGIMLYLKNGTELVLGSGNLQKKWDKVLFVKEGLRQKAQELTYAYLANTRDENKITVRFRDVKNTNPGEQNGAY